MKPILMTLVSVLMVGSGMAAGASENGDHQDKMAMLKDRFSHQSPRVDPRTGITQFWSVDGPDDITVLVRYSQPLPDYQRLLADSDSEFGKLCRDPDIDFLLRDGVVFNYKYVLPGWHIFVNFIHNGCEAPAVYKFGSWGD